MNDFEKTLLQHFTSEILRHTRTRRRVDHPMIRAARRERTRQRESTLISAVYAGYREGVRVILSNGLRGKIVKVNRTRVKVMTDTRGLWNVPPRCMTLEKPVR